jgi:DsbC/DsbD-like thiol-disulfide interchange protein
MKGFKSIIIVFLAVGFGNYCCAQIENPVHWSYAAKRIDSQEAVIFIKAIIDPGWHTYSINQEPGGPVKTSFNFTPSGDYSLEGKMTEPKPVIKFEKSFNMNVSYFEKEVIFQQRIKLKKPGTIVRGTLNFMVCNDQKCLPPDNVEFSIPVK